MMAAGMKSPDSPYQTLLVEECAPGIAMSA
jgi:hypothetical protein